MGRFVRLRLSPCPAAIRHSRWHATRCPMRLAARLAIARAETNLRCCDYRRRRARPGDGVLPRSESRHQEYRRGRACLYRFRECRAKYHAGAFELRDRRQHPVLRVFPETLGGLSHALNFNVMLSQRGQIVLAHGPAQLDGLARRGNIMRLNGIDADLLDRDEVMRLLRIWTIRPKHGFRFTADCYSDAPARCGMTLLPGGTRVRLPRWAWTSSRTARSLASLISQGQVSGVETTRGGSCPIERQSPWQGIITPGGHGGTASADRKSSPAGVRVRAAQTLRG